MRLSIIGLLLLFASGCAGPSRAEREAEARTLEGDVFFDRRDYTAAIPVYEQVLQDLPRFPRARFQLALSWERLGMADRAARSYEGILADSPESPEATQARTRRDRLHALKTWDPARGPKPREILD